jgi:hypothetical protein
MVGRILEVVRMCLGTLACDQGGGVRVPITWQSVALRDVASFKPVTLEFYERWLVRPMQGPAR